MNNKTQEQLFNDWDYQCFKLKEIGNIIQNDITRLLADGYVSKKGIESNLDMFNQKYEYRIKFLEELHGDINTLVKKILEIE
jgi:DUF1009 family protein